MRTGAQASPLALHLFIALRRLASGDACAPVKKGMNLDGIEITIQRTERRKTVSIFIERDGSVNVLAPQSVADEKIEEAVTARQYQIFSKLAKWKELNSGKVNREFVNGQSFLYFGRNYRLAIVAEAETPLQFKANQFLLHKDALPQADRLFREFYRARAKEKIAERLRLIQPKFAEQPTSFRVLELQNRWASCTPSRSLNFHWKCAMAPVGVIDYIITHELVHLKYTNHSREFWNELDKKMPTYRAHVDWLKRNGVKLDLL